MMQPHTLTPAYGSKRRKKMVGRGNASGHGTSSTRGGKGQTARSGGSRGLLLKAFKQQMQATPKLRGFTSLTKKVPEVYLSDLEKQFQNGETVDLAALKTKHIVSTNDRKVKIVATGELSKKLVVVGVPMSKGAAEKIKAVGGEIK